MPLGLSAGGEEVEEMGGKHKDLQQHSLKVRQNQ